MDTDVQRAAISVWVNKGELEKALAVGIHGVPELKHDEKIHYLGEFRERVIKLLTKKQVAEPAIYPEILKALGDKRAVKIIFSGDINYHSAKKYHKLAEKLGKRYSIIHDPEFKGDAGLVVVSDDAVDIEDITVRDRSAKLKDLGIPERIINAAGKKVCGKCLDKILKVAPYESINYSDLTLADRFWGEHCAACSIH